MQRSTRFIAAMVLLFAFATHPSYAQESKVNIEAISTGQTTGHIASLTITNHSDEVVKTGFDQILIPSTGQYQGFAIPEGIHVEVPPEGTVTVPLSGYCTDIHLPPAPAGESMPPFETWITPEIAGPAPEPGFVPAPGSPFQPNETPPDSTPYTITYPGTDTPFPYTIDVSKNPKESAPLVFGILESITVAVDEMYENGEVPPTPFSGNPEKEKEALIQQTFWIATSLLNPNDEDYKKEDFAARTYEQFAETAGMDIPAAPAEVQKQVNQGITDFWNSFEAVGVQAKVLQREATETIGTGSEKERRCVRFPTDPQIDNRTGFDLFGELYRTGKLSFDLNDVRFGYAQKVNAAKGMLSNLETVLDQEFNSVGCPGEETAHQLKPQQFPEFPWEDIFLTVDFCDPANADKHKLSDYLDSDSDLSALENWYHELGHSLDNCGLGDPYSGTYMTYFQGKIDGAMGQVSDAYEIFQSKMETGMALRFNRSRAENRLWQGVIFAVATAASAGIAAGVGGGAAALASAFASTTGFIYEQGLVSMNAGPKMARAVGALISLGLGAASSAGTAAMQIMEESTVSATSVMTLSEGLNAITQQRIRNFAFSLAVLDDDAWNDTKEKLAEDYDQNALNQFEANREELKAEVARAIADMCKVRNSLRQLLPAMEEAQAKASEYLHSSFWRKLWSDAMDISLDCYCCAYSDGSGPSGSCHATIPPFGFDPDEK